MRMRTSDTFKMQENIASMSLTILVGDFQPHMKTSGFRIHANLVKEGSFRINAKLVKEDLSCWRGDISSFLFTQKTTPF